ncbi:hypothetical protein [Keratinibaculum paraultunense]|uniref:hypothetical protein n=1 Tax=Keratinibaculum paraultunense TaxID=1278232 RepID=UPI00104CAC25|nr:hypothetical protein [Keratinibaculum paraultunense]QQY79364.1 hypothetical protein JL105_09245 [Keratinibaculum paraultunense]
MISVSVSMEEVASSSTNILGSFTISLEKAVYTVHSYDQLANNKYMPFTTKYMDIIIERIEDLK